MNIRVYSNGTAEVYENDTKVAVGRIGAKPGQKGYNFALDCILSFEDTNPVPFSIDTPQSLEYK